MGVEDIAGQRFGERVMKDVDEGRLTGLRQVLVLGFKMERKRWGKSWV